MRLNSEGYARPIALSWDWKPYPECKSIRETLAHLIADDRATIVMLKTGKFPDFGEKMEREADQTKLLTLLDESHERLCVFIKERFAAVPLDTEINFWMGKAKLANAIQSISLEDYYHAGQVTFIRLATDPSWDYYANIYGG